MFPYGGVHYPAARAAGNASPSCTSAPLGLERVRHFHHISDVSVPGVSSLSPEMRCYSEGFGMTFHGFRVPVRGGA